MRSRRWAFICDNRADFGVKRICRVLGRSRAGYYRHLATEQARAGRRAMEARTVAEIRTIHSEHGGAYGAPRIHAELRARGHTINRKRVTRLMRVNHIVGRHLRRKKRTTIADRTAPPVPDLVMRDFTADTLNTRWCGDITYIPVGATWLYLATVIDICSRKVAAGPQRHRPGSSCSAADVRRRHGIRRSMGRAGSNYDNALAESYFQALKRKLLHGPLGVDTGFHVTSDSVREHGIAHLKNW